VTPTILLLGIGVLAAAMLLAGSTAARAIARAELRNYVELQLAGSEPRDTALARPTYVAVTAGAALALLLALLGTIIGGQAHGSWSVALVYMMVVLGAIVILGLVLGQAIARRWSARVAPLLLPTVRVSSLLTRPLTSAARALARAAQSAPPLSVATEGVEDLLREEEMDSRGGDRDIEILSGVLQFGDATLHDVMTPRTEVFAVDALLPARAVAEAVAQAGYSRVPVFRESLDEVVGMIHVFDLLKAKSQDTLPIRPVAQAPATRLCSDMLVEMLRTRAHLVVVLDEFGGTAGIVTLEDVLEELVGDIRDEHDEPAAINAVETGGRARVFNAAVELEEIGRVFGVSLGDNTQTLGGYLLRALGRIPVAGERFRVGRLELVIIEAEVSRVQRVLVQRTETATPVDLPAVPES